MKEEKMKDKNTVTKKEIVEWLKSEHDTNLKFHENNVDFHQFYGINNKHGVLVTLSSRADMPRYWLNIRVSFQEIADHFGIPIDLLQIAE